jgi:hypothetical protein
MSNRTEAAQRKLRQLPPGDYRHCAAPVLDSAKVEVDTHFRGYVYQESTILSMCLRIFRDCPRRTEIRSFSG